MRRYFFRCVKDFKVRIQKVLLIGFAKSKNNKKCMQKTLKQQSIIVSVKRNLFIKKENYPQCSKINKK